MTWIMYGVAEKLIVVNITLKFEKFTFVSSRRVMQVTWITCKAMR